eukprot:Sdes_comp27055_c0_seq1m22976
MSNPDDFSKIPLEDRLVHSNWKARLSAYEEAVKLFSSIDDPCSAEFGKYTNYLKKMVVDPNANALDKALDAVFIFTERAQCVEGAAGEIMGGLVSKCFSARDKTKYRAFDIALMLVEIEKGDIVISDCVKGISNKQPKIVVS